MSEITLKQQREIAEIVINYSYNFLQHILETMAAEHIITREELTEHSYFILDMDMDSVERSELFCDYFDKLGKFALRYGREEVHDLEFIDEVLFHENYFELAFPGVTVVSHSEIDSYCAKHNVSQEDIVVNIFPHKEAYCHAHEIEEEDILFFF